MWSTRRHNELSIGLEASHAITYGEGSGGGFTCQARAVYDLSRIKLLPTVRMGKQVRYDERALLEWIKTGRMAHGNSATEPDMPTRTWGSRRW